MKTYFRLLAFAGNLRQFFPVFSLAYLLAVIFGTFNFAMLIPLFDVLFSTEPTKTMAELAEPSFSWSIEFFKDYFNYQIETRIAASGKQAALFFVCSLIVLSVFVSNFFRYIVAVLLNKTRTNFIRNIRQAVFDHYLLQDMAHFSNERKGQIMSHLTTDMQEMERTIVQFLKNLFKGPVTIVIYFTWLVILSPELTVFTIFFLPLSGGLIAELSKRLKKKGREGQQLLGDLGVMLEEVFGGIKIVKAFTAREFVSKNFSHTNTKYAQVTRSMTNKTDLAGPMSEFLGVSVVVGILLYGGSMVLRADSPLSAPAFVTYVIMFSQILEPAKAITSAVSNLQKGLAAGERVLRVLDLQPKITSPSLPEKLETFQDKIEFKNVKFAYAEEDVLRGISFTLPKGKVYALVGPSGGGKSTLADLLPRFYDPTEGGIFLDGHDLRSYGVEDLRRQISVVTQESILFNDTIFNNIAFGNAEATEAQVIEAAKIANAHEFILQQENGYQTHIGDRGVKLSGGQRQRLSIARAVLKNPPILILDEATSALDSESEKLVQEALNNLMRDRTALVIAHRLSTIRHADQILVLEKGQIIEQGTHEELLQQEGGLYQKLSHLQH